MPEIIDSEAITEIWAWIIRSPDGSEGVAAVAKTRERLIATERAARETAAELQASFFPARFVRAEDGVSHG